VSNNVLRRSASILAAGAVVAGGFAIGAGTANADCIGRGILSEFTPAVQPGCGKANTGTSETVAGFTIGHSYPKSAAPGDKVGFTITITNTGDQAKDLTKVVHHPPAGFTLTRVSGYRYGVVADPIALVSTVDPVTGAVEVQLAPGQQLNAGEKMGISFGYDVGQYLSGRSGVTFEATGVPETLEWLAPASTPRQIIGNLVTFEHLGS
jgi:uncharacterized repeat protein (TIGR01451 family)